MKNLLYKELFLSVNKFFYILPIMLAGLIMIPQWVYMIALMYFFWISIPQIFSAYLAQRDYEFTTVLPVKRSYIAISKGLTVIIIELLHLVLIAIAGIAHNLVYGSFNIFIDISPAFYGYALIMFAIFNVIYLPLYFRTAYYFGKPLILAVVVVTIYGVGLELLTLLVPWATRIIDNPNIFYQIGMLFAGILIFLGLNWLALYKSARNYENIK
ncbi:MAG: ABC-2 transporter permease [Acholeplasmataceae bacterium]|nr:ABC-2 transporter permease [Acholeplasmataceae bacterium]